MAPERRAARIEAAMVSSGGLSIPPPAAERFGLTDPAQIAWVNRRLTPQPVSVEASRLELSHDIGNGVPCTYVRLRDPHFAGDMLGSDTYARERSDWAYLEVDATHDGMVSAPDLITELLDEVVSGTTG